jgi:predicted restriction endonuclease
MVKTYEQSAQRRILEYLFQSHVPITSPALADSLSLNFKTVSGTLSMLTRVPELREIIQIDKSVMPWLYYIPKKVMTVDDMTATFRKRQKTETIVKNIEKRKYTRKAKEEQKPTLLLDKICFSKGTALRLTGDIIVAGIDIFLDMVVEVVKGEKE